MRKGRGPRRMATHMRKSPRSNHNLIAADHSLCLNCTCASSLLCLARWNLKVQRILIGTTNLVEEVLVAILIKYQPVTRICRVTVLRACNVRGVVVRPKFEDPLKRGSYRIFSSRHPCIADREVEGDIGFQAKLLSHCAGASRDRS